MTSIESEINELEQRGEQLKNQINNAAPSKQESRNLIGYAIGSGILLTIIIFVVKKLFFSEDKKKKKKAVAPAKEQIKANLVNRLLDFAIPYAKGVLDQYLRKAFDRIKK